MINMEIISQIAIIIFNILSHMFKPSKTAKIRMYGFLVALCAGPFWAYSTFKHNQFGMFLVFIWALINNARGLYNNFILDRNNK